MHLSLGPLIFTLLLTQRLFRFSKINNHPTWERLFRYVRYFAIFLFVAEIILSASNATRWIWHIILISLVLFAFQQKEMRSLRMFLMAFIPYVLVSFLSDSIQFILSNFYNRWENYFDIAEMLSVIWLVAILFSHYRQSKAEEKERIKRQHEDEVNRAIAIRKVELEGLVAERTAELTKQKEDLEHALNELRATQDQLIQSEKMASLGELTAGIAHEIQNPLNFVNNFSEVNAELLEEMKEELKKGNMQFANEIAGDIKQNLEKILHHGKRADSIVKGMLQHSRSNTGIKEPTDINVLADEYLRLAYHGLRAKDKSFNATLKTDFDESLDKVEVVPQEIGRVVLNLLTNAFYAVSEKKKRIEKIPTTDDEENKTPYMPTVVVSTKKLGRKVEIKVSDNGDGIPQAVLDKIFQPFFTTKPSGKGTGLGLSMSYEIVTKAHNGQLKVENNEGEGATFTILLPVK
ncbi:ATP-binding protein [uncultured Sunxiuqinia sp.]|uniref:sensor histidine kinase n=1 Tax=uncultured Sunxiuqinia sp. TaxID=1573825 RepID=UPI0030DA356E|tara:strand:+ start:4097 stop:5482 length:1386 start_codon:yes stop_codon:yes gene_type:complete